MKRVIWKRLLSVLLSVLMLSSLLPANVLAQEFADLFGFRAEPEDDPFFTFSEDPTAAETAEPDALGEAAEEASSPYMLAAGTAAASERISKVKVLDRNGSPWSGSLYALDPDTGDIIRNLSWDYDYDNRTFLVPESVFGGGEIQLVSVVREWSVNYAPALTTGFRDEITLDARSTIPFSLVFSDGVTTMTEGSFLVSYGENAVGGEIGSGGTGEMYVTPGENYTVWASSTAQKMLIIERITADEESVSLADAISAAVPFTVEAADKLDANDFWSIGFRPEGETEDRSYNAILGPIPSSEKTVRLTPGIYEMSVGIYDCTLPVGETGGEEYAGSVHMLGEIDTRSQTSVDFDPAYLETVLLSDSEVTKRKGARSVSAVLAVRDDRGNPVFSDYTGSFFSLNGWLWTSWQILADGHGPIAYSSYDSDEWPNASECEIELDQLGGEVQYDTPITVIFEPYFNVSGDGLLNYEKTSASTTFVLTEGGTFELLGSFYRAEGYAFHRGRVTGLTKINWSEIFDLSGLDAGDPILFCVTGYDETLGMDVCDFVRTEYDPAVHFAEFVPAGSYYTVSLTADGEDIGVYEQFAVPLGDGYVFCPARSDTGYPAGEYLFIYCEYLDPMGSDVLTLFGRNVTLPDGHIDLDTSGFRTVTITAENENALYLCPTVCGVSIESGGTWENSYNESLMLRYDPVSVDEILVGVGPLAGKKGIGKEEYDSGSRCLHVLVLPEGDSFVLPYGDLTSFEAASAKSVYEAGESVSLDVFAFCGEYRVAGIIAESTRISPKEGLGIAGSGPVPITVTLRNLSSGAESVVRSDDWRHASLGALESGSYFAAVSFDAPDGCVMTARTASCSFEVGNASVTENHVSLSGPETAYFSVDLTVNGVPGAEVTVSGSAPDGSEITPATVVLPDSGTETVTFALSHDGEYIFHAVSVWNGFAAESDLLTVRCSIAPPADVTVTAEPEGNRAVRLRWKASEGAVGYRVLRGGAEIASLGPTVLTYLDTGLNEGLEYTYAILAEAASGSLSNPIPVTCVPVYIPDEEAPTAPKSLWATVTGTMVSLSWSRSTDDSGVAGYLLTRNGEEIARVTDSRQYTDFAPDTGDYTYAVRAYDAAMNMSGAAEKTVTADTPGAIEFFEVSSELTSGILTGDSVSFRLVSSAQVKKAVVTAVWNDGGTEVRETVELSGSSRLFTGSWGIPESLAHLVRAEAKVYGGSGELLNSRTEDLDWVRAGAVEIAFTLPNAGFAPTFLASSGTLTLKGTDVEQSYTCRLGQTEDTGSYRFEKVAPGSYTLVASLRGIEIGTASVTVLPGKTASVSLDASASGLIRIGGTTCTHRPERGNDGKPFVVYAIKDGYLTDADGDSAFFWPEDTMELLPVSSYLFSDNRYYSLKNQTVMTASVRSGGYVFTPPVGEANPARTVTVRFDGGSAELYGLPVSASTYGYADLPVNSNLKLDAAGCAAFSFPDSGTTAMTLTVHSLNLQNGLRTAERTYTVPLTAAGEYTVKLAFEAEPNVHIRLRTSNGSSLAGETVILSWKSGNSFNSGSRYVTLNANGTADVPVNAASDTQFKLTAVGRYLSDNNYLERAELISSDGSFDAVLPVTEKTTLTYRVRFVSRQDVPLEGIPVRFTDRVTGRTQSVPIGADGTCEAQGLDVRCEVNDQRAGSYILSLDSTGLTGVPQAQAAAVPAQEVVLETSALLPLSFDWNGMHRMGYTLYFYDLYGDASKPVYVAETNASYGASGYIVMSERMIGNQKFSESRFAVVPFAGGGVVYESAYGPEYIHIPLSDWPESMVFTLDMRQHTRETPLEIVNPTFVSNWIMVRDLAGADIRTEANLCIRLGKTVLSERAVKSTVYDPYNVTWYPFYEDLDYSVLYNKLSYAKYSSDPDLYARLYRPVISSPERQEFTLGYQKTFEIRILGADGRPFRSYRSAYPINHAMFGSTEKVLLTASKWDKVYAKAFSCYLTDSTFTITVSDAVKLLEVPQHSFELYFALNGDMNWAIDDMYPFWSTCPDAAAVSLDLLPTASSDTRTVTLGNPVYRLSRIFGDLDTSFKSVAETSSGVYEIRMEQAGAGIPGETVYYESFIRLPAGAFNITVDGAAASREILLPEGQEKHSIVFEITEADLAEDRNIECYILTEDGNPDSRNLQFVREIPFKMLDLSLRQSVSDTEIICREPTWNEKQKTEEYTVILGGSESVVGGGKWGLTRESSVETMPGINILSASPSYETMSGPVGGDFRTGASDIPADYTVWDYQKEWSDRKEGLWLSFKSAADDFAVALRVDDLPVYTHEMILPMVTVAYTSGALARGGTSAAFLTSAGTRTKPGDEAQRSTFYATFPPSDETAVSRFRSGYESREDGVYYWMSKAEFERLGFMGDGEYYLFVPLHEPDRYPCSYDVSLSLKYADANGEIRTVTEEKQVVMHSESAVLEKWRFEHLNGINSVVFDDEHINIRSADDRIDEERQNRRDSYYIDWNGSNVFRCRAWFDKPEEVAEVYACADVPDYCAYSSFPLTWDEGEGCFVGTGMLGDALNPPSDFTVGYSLKVDQLYDGLIAVDADDISADADKRGKGAAENDGLPEGWSWKETAPGNGWSLAKCRDMWDRYAAAISDYNLTEAEIASFTDTDGILWYPAYEFYENGSLQFTVSNTVDFSGNGFSGESCGGIAVLSGGNCLGKVERVCSADADALTFTLSSRSDNPALLLPIPAEDGEAATGSLSLPERVLDRLFDALIGWTAVPAKAISLGGIGKNISKALHMNIGLPAGSENPIVSAALRAEKNGNKELINGIMNLDAAKGLGERFVDSMLDTKPGWYYELPDDMKELYDDYHRIDNIGAVAESVVGLFLPVGGSAAMFFFDKYLDPRRAEIDRKLRDIGMHYLYWKYGIPKMCYHIDPSGYVFEGTENNPLEGVSATVYYLEPGTGKWNLWDSEAYGEGPNPNITDGNGGYGWDVLVGKWKVVFEKDGYFLAESEELNVPPAHTDVNISFVSTEPAAPESITPHTGYADIRFTKPVLTETALERIKVKVEGFVTEGALVPLDEGEVAFGNKQSPRDTDVRPGTLAARTFRFTPSEEDGFLVGDAVIVETEAGILTYNGLELDAAAFEAVTIPTADSDPVTDIRYEGKTVLNVGESLNLYDGTVFSGTPGEVVFTASAPEIAAVSGGVVTALAEGDAIITVEADGVVTAVVIQVTDPLRQAADLDREREAAIAALEEYAAKNGCPADAAVVAQAVRNGKAAITAASSFAEITAAEDAAMDVIDAQSHDWGDPVWRWAPDMLSAEAVFTCRNNAAHTMTLAAELSDEIGADGMSVLATSVTLNGRTYTDRRKAVTPGDVNGDGSVTAADRMLLARWIDGLVGDEEQIILAAADVNRDSKVTETDRLILSRYLADWPGYDKYFG
ncbi:MAG: hypothetical protein E7576_05915 [Ruminococcaceae bacterium]|jgi:hypothetical protein|nr:hypothetical protein [Oscillospiraceae bacterium]